MKKLVFFGSSAIILLLMLNVNLSISDKSKLDLSLKTPLAYANVKETKNCFTITASPNGAYCKSPCSTCQDESCSYYVIAGSCTLDPQ